MTSTTPMQPAEGRSVVARQHMQAIWRSAGMVPILIVIGIMFQFLSGYADTGSFSDAWANGRFMTGQNLSVVAQQAAINTVLGAGMTFVILTGGIDLSVGSILAVSAMGALIVSKSATLGLLSVPVGMLIGAVFGVINGGLIAAIKLPPFIVTLGSLTAVRGIARLMGDDTTVFNPDLPFAIIGNGSLFGISWLVVIAIVVVAISWFVLRRTVLGVHIYAVGGNAAAARLAGIKVWAVLLFVYGASGLLSGLGGVMQAARLYAANGLQSSARIRARRHCGGHPGRHELRRRRRVGDRHPGRGAHHRGAGQWPHPHRRLGRLAIYHQGPGHHRCRRARPLPQPGERPHLNVSELRSGSAPVRNGSGRGARRRIAITPRESSMLKKILLAGAAVALATTMAQAKELKTIGVSLGSLGNPFFIALAKGAEFEAKKTNPNVKLLTFGYDYDLGKQVTQIDNFIAAGVDLILLNPGDPKALKPAIQKAQAAGIKVVAVDTAADGADATVTTDNVQRRPDLLPIYHRQAQG